MFYNLFTFSADVIYFDFSTAHQARLPYTGCDLEMGHTNSRFKVQDPKIQKSRSGNQDPQIWQLNPAKAKVDHLLLTIIFGDCFH